MKQVVNIGIIGDFDPDRASHTATNAAIQHAANALSLETTISWVPTTSILAGEGQQKLRQFSCLWASSGSPYKSMSGAIRGIQIARELDRPFIGT